MRVEKRHASAVGGAHLGNGKGGGNSRKEIEVDESRKETADRLAITTPISK